MESLRFGATYWEDKLGDLSNESLDILSYLWFYFLIKPVKDRATRFLGYTPSHYDPNGRFPAAHIFSLWLERCKSPAQRDQIAVMVKPVAKAIMLEESDRVITDISLQIRINYLTISRIRELLDPSELADKYRSLAPFFFELLHVFVASPNKYRKYNMGHSSETEGNDTQIPEGGAGDAADWGDDPNEDYDEVGHPEAEPTSQWAGFEGFSRNPIFAIILIISMLAFVHNRATNLLPLLLCLFFKICSASTRVIRMLSNVGVCVSRRTAEQLKECISEDTIRLGVALARSRKMFMTIFDNINIFLRKSQQRLTNRNSMIHATNFALFALEGIDPAAQDLKPKLDMCGEHKKATVEDILPTNDDDAHLEQSFIALIAEMIVLYCPGSRDWKDHKEMLEEIKKMMPKDRPLDPKKTDARPFGVFDINEGSKKGVIDVVDAIRERSTLSKAEWASKMRIIQGDWLTANNFWNRRRIRKDHINAYERMEYGDDLSALFHHALQASHMLMKVHYGHAVHDSMSLAANEGMLNHTWDVNKPNYAASKSLILHSSIARILHCVMVKNSITLVSQLNKWRPTLEDIKVLSTTLIEEFSTTTAAEKAKPQMTTMSPTQHILFGMPYSSKNLSALPMRGESCVFSNIGHSHSGERDNIIMPVNNNYWVKHVFIASGSGVTVEYIIAKGSACIEAFREISHSVANFFGDSDRARWHNEVAFHDDIRALIEEMVCLKAHVISPEGRFVPAPPKAGRKKKNHAGLVTQAEPRSAIVDVIVEGAQEWQSKFKEFLRKTTWDPKLGYPLVKEKVTPWDTRLRTATILDSTNEDPISCDTCDDLHGDEIAGGGLGAGALGGGDEFSSGHEA
ncbi:hypothetical protein B0H10DRAFT_1950737 [Mycena sp. CBHHK59/15]|nr:hypothetical protein B0H10DRAFT_1950737 [Mycena sp. CBHHK59/15]